MTIYMRLNFFFIRLFFNIKQARKNGSYALVFEVDLTSFRSRDTFSNLILRRVRYETSFLAVSGVHEERWRRVLNENNVKCFCRCFS